MYYVVQEYGPGIHKPPMLKFLSRPFKNKEEADLWKNSQIGVRQNHKERKIYVIFICDHPKDQLI